MAFLKQQKLQAADFNGGPLDGEGTSYFSYIIYLSKNIKLEKDASKEGKTAKKYRYVSRTVVTERAVKMPILPICRMDVWQDLSILI